MEVSSRFVMPPMQIGMVDGNGAPLPAYIPYYCDRVEGGIGLVIVESTAVDHPSATGQSSATRIIPRNAAAWTEVVRQVHRSGGRILLQLWHEGAVRPEGHGPHPNYPSLSPSGLAGKGHFSGRACSDVDLQEIKRAFVEGAVLAQSCGFDGVELHGAHGYLLDTFLWQETNLREDRYGGPLEQRTTFAAEIINEIRHRTGPEFVISYRFSQFKEIDFSAKVCPTPESLGRVMLVLRSAGVDIFDISARRFYDPEFEGSELGIAGWVKKLTDAPVIAVGSVGLDIDLFHAFMDRDREAQLTSPVRFAELVSRFENGEFDMIAIGRSILADPAFIQKMRDGRYDEIIIFSKDTMRNFGEQFSWNPGLVGEVHGFSEISATGLVSAS